MLNATKKEQLGEKLFKLINPSQSWLHQPPMITRLYVKAAVELYREGHSDV
jgi:hypothetical protein